MGSITYALISDIHGNLPALEAILRDAQYAGAKRFVFLGDYCLGLFEPNETMDMLRRLKNAVFVSGNEDSGLVTCPDEMQKGQYHARYWYRGHLSKENLAFLSELPNTTVLRESKAPPIFLFHKPETYFKSTMVSNINPHYYALGRDSNQFNKETFSVDFLKNDQKLSDTLSMLEDGVYAFGHTHIQWHEKIDGKLLVNAGSAGLPLDFDRKAAYTLLNFSGGEWSAEPRRVTYDVDLTLERFKQSICMQSVPVWCGIIYLELKTAREQATPFLHYTESFANQRNDNTRPFAEDTWNDSFNAWISGVKGDI